MSIHSFCPFSFNQILFAILFINYDFGFIDKKETQKVIVNERL